MSSVKKNLLFYVSNTDFIQTFGVKLKYLKLKQQS